MRNVDVKYVVDKQVDVTMLSAEVFGNPAHVLGVEMVDGHGWSSPEATAMPCPAPRAEPASAAVR